MVGNNKAYIIGNGTSRKGFNLESLRGAGTIIGCNALYREFMPDYIVSIDAGIINEIRGSDFPKDKFIVPPLEEHWEPEECNPNRPRSNAGMNAMAEAIKMGHNILVCLGFDFLIKDAKQSVSNLFHDSKNYGLDTRANAMDNPGRIRYLRWFANRHKGCEFHFVFPATIGYPKKIRLTSMSDCGNISFEYYDDVFSGEGE